MLDIFSKVHYVCVNSSSLSIFSGPKVISKVIPLSSIEELGEVLQRPPVIWDNLHANDYDQGRLFLGPYVGRPVALLSKLNGVLTNPNCEYGANYVAIHTMQPKFTVRSMASKRTCRLGLSRVTQQQFLLLKLYTNGDKLCNVMCCLFRLFP